MTKRFSAECPPLSVVRRDGRVVIENAFVRWEHDPAQGGELSGAFVLNGTASNILAEPQFAALCPWVRGGWRQYHPFETRRAKADELTFSARDDGGVDVRFTSGLADADGAVLDGAHVVHSIRYHASGAADHAVEIVLDRDMDLGQVHMGSFSVRDDFDRLAVRPCSAAAWSLEIQNPCRWIDLVHAKSRLDLPAYQSRFLPLSVLFLKSGVEAIEMALGDDLAAWDRIGTDFPGLAQGSVFEARDPWRFKANFAPLDSPRAGNILKAGTYRFTYRMALPYVKERMVPLEAAGAFLKASATPEGRWPSEDEIRKMVADGVALQRLHNDGDLRGDGIFWRDAAYPPYPPAEMARMDACLAAAKKAGADVVPYFSCKEWHPEAQGFAEGAERCARQVLPGERYMENFFGTSLFGMQMCLGSDWFETRRGTIAQVLDNHAFNGVYYDWCMGLECINGAHGNGRRHWDNDRLLDLVEWSRAKVGRDGRIYLHLTNVPSLAIENLGDNILVEESEYFEIFPEMFTPQVHFLNVAPRSICVMLPANMQTRDRMVALALAALLHHATLCVGYNDPSRHVLDFYRSHRADIDALAGYSRHSAPGEGVTSTGGSREVGMSVYWTADRATGLLANLTDRPRTAKWAVDLGAGRKFDGETEVPPLNFVLVPLEGKGAPCA